jgi:hypothetical protein
MTARSAQSGFGRATCRRKTATLCRSTKISTSLSGTIPRDERQPAERPDYQQVDKSDEHERRA